MDIIVRKINVYFVHQFVRKKWVFITVYNETTKKKRCYIVGNSGKRKEVTKDVGNKMYQRLIRCFPTARTSILVANDKGGKVSYVKVMDHYDILVDGQFVESCDVGDLSETVKKYEEIANNR